MNEPRIPSSVCEPAMREAERDDAIRQRNAAAFQALQRARTIMQTEVIQPLAGDEDFFGVSALVECSLQAAYRARVHLQGIEQRRNRAQANE